MRALLQARDDINTAKSTLRSCKKKKAGGGDATD